jgi:glyoxylate reductase
MVNRPRIIVTRSIASTAIDRLREQGEVWVWPEDRPIPPPVLEQWAEQATAVVSMLTDRLDSVFFHQQSQLQIVANMAVGYDNIDIEAATRARVVVTNTPDVLTEATADLTWALILAVMRGVVSANRALLTGGWTGWHPEGFLGTDVYGKTLGIVGFGRIGQAVARRAAGFGVRVILMQRSSSGEAQAPYPRLPREQFLAEADIVSLHVPLNASTRRLVNREWLRAMKPGAVLVNTARGAIIDHQALLEALDDHLGGAALDVFDPEPVAPDDPIVLHPKVLATPHIGSATRETREAMAHRAVDNVVAYLNGQRPPDWLNPFSA